MKKKTDDQIEELKKQVEEWKAKYLRALADYQNLERRTQAEVGEVRKYAAEVILSRLLPMVDTFERAQKHLKDKGLSLALKELFALLEEQGVRKIEVISHEFNPHEMECVEVGEGEENKVIEEVLSGYRMHEKVLRIAQVKVGKQEINREAVDKTKPELLKGDYM